MSFPRLNALAVLLALTVTSCSSTKLVTKWQAPSVEPLAFTKVLALALTPDASLRRVAERAVCKQVTSVPCEPAHRVVAESEMDDVAKVKEIVRAAGFDGAVVLRVVSAEEKVTYVPPSYGPTFWGYYAYAMPTTYAPAYYRADQIVRVETSIYSLSQDRLLWVATTETLNPKNVPSLVEDVAKAVRRELQKEKLIPDR